MNQCHSIKNDTYRSLFIIGLTLAKRLTVLHLIIYKFLGSSYKFEATVFLTKRH